MRGPVVLATRSAGKLRELRPLFADAGFAAIDLDEAGIPATEAEEPIECHDTFEANAVAKARYFSALAGGLTVVADDSGLEVAALGGAPGVHSKRWSGRGDLTGAELDDANNRLLLDRLRGVADRRARFQCVAAWFGEGRLLVAHGSVDGRIVERGEGSGGFGYDPYFYSGELRKTLGSASLAEKQRVSHRGRAVRLLLERVASLRDGRGAGG